MSMEIKSTPNTSYTAKADKSEKMSDTERKKVWEGSLKEGIDNIRSPKNGGTPLLSDWRLERMEGKIAEDMKEWMADPKNANATPEQIAAAADDSMSKRYGYEFTTKMMDDNFMANIMRRAKELTADLWS